jgi:hypothetical protein
MPALPANTENPQAPKDIQTNTDKKALAGEHVKAINKTPTV